MVGRFFKLLNKNGIKNEIRVAHWYTISQIIARTKEIFRTYRTWRRPGPPNSFLERRRRWWRRRWLCRRESLEWSVDFRFLNLNSFRQQKGLKQKNYLKLSFSSTKSSSTIKIFKLFIETLKYLNFFLQQKDLQQSNVWNLFYSTKRLTLKCWWKSFIAFRDERQFV